MITDFRRVTVSHSSVIIKDTEVSRVDSYQYLGFAIQHNNEMVGSHHRPMQEGYSAYLSSPQIEGVPRGPLLTGTVLPVAVIHRILTYGCTLWGGSCTKRVWEWRRMSRVVRLASKIILSPLENVNTSYHARLITKARAIMSDPLHPLNRAIYMAALQKEAVLIDNQN